MLTTLMWIGIGIAGSVAPTILIALFSHFVWPRDRGFRVTGRY